jgi:hypothetical protein
MGEQLLQTGQLPALRGKLKCSHTATVLRVCVWRGPIGEETSDARRVPRLASGHERCRRMVVLGLAIGLVECKSGIDICATLQAGFHGLEATAASACDQQLVQFQAFGTRATRLNVSIARHRALDGFVKKDDGRRFESRRVFGVSKAESLPRRQPCS